MKTFTTLIMVSFKFRTRSALFKANFGDRYESKGCPLFFVQVDTQVHSTQCQIVNQKVEIRGKYSDIFRTKIPTDISKTLLKISLPWRPLCT